MGELRLTLRMEQEGSAAGFTLAPTDELLSVLQTYSTSLGLNVHALGFRFDGQLILPYMTPAQLEMEDGDVVDVFQAKPSGMAKRGRSRSNSPEQAGKRSGQ